MRHITFGLVLAVAACGSAQTQDDIVDDGTTPDSGGGGQAGGRTDSGGGGQAGGRTDSGTGGASAASGGHTAAGGALGSGGASAGTGGKATGGAGGTGGTSGSGGGSPQDSGGPHVVQACPTGNGAPGKVGVWEDITPPVLKGLYTPGGAIVVNPKDTRTVYAGSAIGGGLFKSTDCGASFVHVNTGTNGSHVDSGRIWDMAIDPVDPEVLYVIEGYGDGGLWKTTNGGVDWINTTPSDSNVGQTANGNFTSIVGMDVTDHLHLLLAFHSGCSGAYAPNCQAETKDGGATWRLLKAPAAGEGVGVIVLGPTTWVSGAWGAMWETTDSGGTWNTVSTANAHWQLYHSPSGAFYIGTQSGILKSTDGKTWNLIPGFNQPVQGITGDGTNIFAGQQWGSRLFKIPESNPAGFTELPPTDGNSDGPYFMSYDPDHHIVYASEFQHGHWRMVTQ